MDAFAIGRYPVTNAQYRYFIEDDGYDKEDYWTEEGWGYRKQGGWTEPRLWDDERFNQPNQPVVGVSWYEAVAHCRWLSRKTNQSCRLATEAEWERAARHSDGREYPWGDTWQEDATNYQETGIKRPSAVGIFPIDSAVCGVQDMAGNISEWCQTRWHEETEKEYAVPYRSDDGREDLGGKQRHHRVWRGGAWNDKNKSWLCCAFRDGHLPHGHSLACHLP